MRGVKEEKRQEGTDVKEGKTPIMGHINLSTHFPKRKQRKRKKRKD